MIKIGITGGIGSGKSTVSEVFKKKKAVVVDSDKIVSFLLKKGEEGHKKVISHFGEKIVDKKGEIDKKKLAKIVFENEEERKNLEKIIHPLVIEKRRDIFEQLKKIMGKDEIVIAEAALIFEAKTEKDFDFIILVKADKDKRIERLQKKGFSVEEIEKRMSSQLGDEEKEKLADYVIVNNGSIKELERAVEKIIREVKKNVS